MATIPLKTIQFPDLPDTYVVAPPITDTASGSIASFTDGADDLPVADLTVAIVPKQAGSGTPSPSNVRPISGFTKATVTRAGKNVLPMTLDGIKAANTAGTWSGNSYTQYGLTYTVQTDSAGCVVGILVNGTSTAGVSLVLAGVTLVDSSYILSGCASGGADSSYFIQLYGTGFDDREYGSGKTITGNKTGTLIIYCRSGVTFSNKLFLPMIRPASIADSTFEPYTADTYEVSFGSAGTVYGGTLDVTTGKLTVTKKAVDMGTLEWTMPATSIFSSPTLPDVITPTAEGDTGSICSMFNRVNYPTAWASGTYTMCDSNFSSQKCAFIYDTTYSTAAAFKTAVTGQTLVYTLATPIEYNLTPTEVRTLLGVNNIWSDTGDTTVEYRADTGLYIDKLTGSTEEDMIADAPIASGKYFFVGNTLYLSTAAIAAGATLTPGTNCVKTSLAEALNALNS